MANTKTVIIPLNDKNYPTWKIQCRIAPIKNSLWGIVQGTEVAPGEENAEVRWKYFARRDGGLAVVVLSVEPSLFYLLGDPKDPQVVWTRLEGSFRGKRGATGCSYGKGFSL